MFHSKYTFLSFLKMASDTTLQKLSLFNETATFNGFLNLVAKQVQNIYTVVRTYYNKEKARLYASVMLFTSNTSC